MEFYLQQGYGMNGINEEFSKEFKGIGIILSPRALKKSSAITILEEHARKLKRKSATIMFDPQFYVPNTHLHKILKFPYFDLGNFDTCEFNKSNAENFCKSSIEYQIDKINVDKIIIPGRYSNSLSTDWYDTHEKFIEVSQNVELEKEKYLTLALGPDVVKNKNEFDKLINKCVNYPIDGYYIVLKFPDGKFLVDDEDYLYSILDGLLSLSISGKKIIMGYCNQQSIIYSTVGVETIASGNYRNVRSFDPTIFDETDEEDFGRRSTWYFDGYSFGEYKSQQLSLAYRRGLKGEFGPKCKYCNELLNSNNPANIIWKEGESFKHFLFELRNQWLNIDKVPKNKRIDFIIEKFEEIQERNNFLKSKGFTIGKRGFKDDILDAVIGALNSIKFDRKYDILQL